MFDDIKDSIKAKLYDFAYTPFMSSYIISWVLFNHKYLLVYFGNSTLDDKLIYLSKCHIEFLYPLWIALIYVFIYPAFALAFYYATLFYNKWSKKVKQKIEDETPITQEEARQIRSDIERLARERDAYIEKIVEIEKNYEEKYKRRMNELALSEWTADANNKQELEVMEDKSSTKNAQTPDESKESDEQKVLRFFYESNYKPNWKSDTLDRIVNKIQIPRPKAEKILNGLISQETLEQASDIHKTISITPKGNSELIDMFDKE